jgi:hypothetical protein
MSAAVRNKIKKMSLDVIWWYGFSTAYEIMGRSSESYRAILLSEPVRGKSAGLTISMWKLSPVHKIKALVTLFMKGSGEPPS